MKTIIHYINQNLPKAILILVCYNLGLPLAKSSHIVGGEMTYRCLGGQSYEITLTLRRDCFNGSPEAEFDDPAHIGIFDGEGSQIRTLPNFGILLLDFRKDDTLNEILKTECEVIGGDVCVHTTTYRGKVELPFRLGGYILAYQRCCRNKTISNIENPELIGATYSVIISEDALRYCNKAPKFGPFPPIYICGDRSIVFDNSVKDEEGDSIVYSLCVPYAGADTANAKPTRPSKPPFPMVTYKAPFSLNDLLGASPPLTIDRKTGLITGKPNAIGQYLVAICVDEYRNGRLLSRIRRDFEYNVRFCTTNPVSNFDADNSVLCKGDSTVHFTNHSINSRDYTWIFDYPNQKYISKDTNPTFTFPKPGKYKVALIAIRAKDCIDTTYKEINLYGDNELGSDFDAVYGSCRDSIEISLIDKSFDSLLHISNWNWFAQLRSNIYTSTKQNPKFLFSDTGNLTVNLIVTSSGGCRDTIEKDFILNRLKPNFLSEKIPICIGETTKLITNPDGRFNYTWNPSTDLSCNNCPNPTANPKNDILYKVTITDGNCTEEDSVLVKVSTLLDIDITGDTVICNDAVNLLAIGGVDTTVQWSDKSDFSNILKSGSFQFNTTLNGKQTFYVRARSASNCPGSDSIHVDNEKVIIQTSIDSITICQDDTFHLKINNLRPEQQAIINWYPSDKIISGQGTDSIVLRTTDCGPYKLYATLENQYKCKALDSVEIRTICKPSVDFKVDKNCDNTLVSFSNLSSPGRYKWDFGDGTESVENGPIHMYNLPGTYTVSLKVEAECANSITKVIDVGFIRVPLKDRVVSCHGLPVELNANPDTNYHYIWTPAKGLNDPNSPNPKASVTETTTYEVQIVDKNIPDCFINRKVTVFVPPPINLNVNNDTVLCYTGKLLLQAKTDSFATIEWTDEIGILLGSGYQLQKEFKDSMFIYAYATDQYGCGEKDSFRIVPIKVNYKLTGTKNLCPGADGSIKFNNLDGHQYKLDWSPRRFIINDTNKASIIIKPTDTTVFYLNLINEYGCEFNDSFQVNISRFVPPLEAYADQDTIYLGDSTTLHVNRDYSNYKWIIPYNLSCDTCTDPIAKPTNSILYTVQAKNDDGCMDQADVRVIVIRPKCNESDIFFPNIFSPNGDGENDILEIRSNFLESVELYVYDRWGQKVFETKDIHHWWDGRYNGADLAPDVYAYYFKVICVDGQKYAKKGNVTLIK
jgi:gliding motility-associated-like protein